MHLYQDASKAPAERAKDLLGLLTLEEKVAQLSGIWAYELLTDFIFDEKKAANRMAHGIGQITRAGGCSSLKPKDTAKFVNRVQKYLKDNMRIFIPAQVHEESCAGFLSRDADVFPQALGVAASFEPEIAAEMGAHIREQMAAVGARQALAPLMDVTRDPRWGRTEETYGEDPFLVAQMGVSYIRGLQGDDMKSGIVATGKHFVGYGAGEGGMNWAPAHIPPRELEETYLYPFEAAVRAGGLKSIMPGYHELDGVPCHTNRQLIQGILREKWGFDGIVVSDYFAIGLIHTCHGAAMDEESAARMALDAGVDVELPSTNCYGEPLIRAVREGLVDETLVDEAVLRVLRIKFELGLFENPFVDEGGVEAHFHTEAQHAFALKAAEKSLTLLKNDGVLPISRKIKKIAVVGPNADDVRNMLGDYSFPAHVESLIDQNEDNFASTPTPEGEYSVNDALPEMDSVLAGLKKYRPDVQFIYARGCGVLDGDDGEIEAAVEAARGAELVVAIMGDKAGLILDCTSGEARDRTTLELPGRQRELLMRLKETGVPVALVLINGRPFSLTWEDANLSAILEAWLPGEEGALAIAKALFGEISPAGRLPITFPRAAGQVPVYYAHKPSGGKSHWKGAYVDESNLPLYAFGHGLTYTRFGYGNLKLPPSVPVDGKLVVEADVVNTGDVAGEEVVQLYIRDDCAFDVTRPVKELKGFKRVYLEPGERKTVRFTVDTAILSFLNRAGEFVVEPGTHTVMVGASSSDIRLEGKVELTGPVRKVQKRVFETRAEVL